MAERVVKVTVSANVAAFKKGMDEVALKTRQAGTEVEKLAQTRAAFDAIGKGAVVMGGLIAAGLTVAVARFAEFDQAMSNVEAATNETADNMDRLRKAAIDAGASTVFSATEAANAIEELAKAGLSTEQILSGGLNGALSLAAAGQLSVADAAQIAAVATKQFNLAGSDVPHVADLLAAGAGKAVGDVSDLSQALAQAGLVANGAGQSIEDTTGVLAAFADAGLLGSDAGTSLKAAIIALQAPTDKSRGVMEQYGLSFYDANGRMSSFEKIAGQLQTKLSGLTDEQRNAALATIFGTDALRSANVLYTQGADGIQKYIDQTNDAGYAAEQARKRLDNLKGDLEALGGALDSALIQSGSGANDVLRDMVQALTGLTQAYSDLPPDVQEATVLIGGATAAVALAGGTALLAVPKFLEMRSTITAAGISMKNLGIGAGTAGLALGGLFLIVGQLAQRHAEARQRAESYAETLEDTTHRITDATKKLVAENLQKTPGFWDGLFGKVDGPGSVLDAAAKLGIRLDKVTDAAAGSSQALSDLAPYLKRVRTDSQFAADEAERLGMSQYDLELAALKVQNGIQGESESLDEAIRLSRQKEAATTALADTNETSAAVAETAAGAYLTEASALGKTEDELSRLIKTIDEANGRGQDAITSNIAYRDALAKVDEQIQKARDGVDGYALTLDMNTQAGRDNMGMLVDLASNAQDAAQKQFELDHNTESYRATLEASRQALLDRAKDLGYNDEQAGALADSILRIPSSTEWTAIAQTAEAASRIDRLQAAINGLQDKTIRINIQMPNGEPVTDRQLADQLGFGYRGGIAEFYAKGGIRDLVPMNKVASVVAPNTWRVVGDRPDVPESFIPLDGSARSLAILAETNRRMPGWNNERWNTSPQYATHGAPQVHVASPSMEGLQIQGTLDLGDGLTGMIDGRIVASNNRAATAVRYGRSTR